MSVVNIQGTPKQFELQLKKEFIDARRKYPLVTAEQTYPRILASTFMCTHVASGKVEVWVSLLTRELAGHVPERGRRK